MAIVTMGPCDLCHRTCTGLENGLCPRCASLSAEEKARRYLAQADAAWFVAWLFVGGVLGGLFRLWWALKG